MNQPLIRKLAYPILPLLAVVCVGCGPKELPYTDNSQDPFAYARDVKGLVVSAARRAKASSEPVDFLAPALLELKRTDRPVGEHRSIYEDLRNRLDQLVRDCEQAGGKAPNLSARLDELIKLAQTLPGDAPQAVSD
jgi:hypothetical protein